MEDFICDTLTNYAQTRTDFEQITKRHRQALRIRKIVRVAACTVAGAVVGAVVATKANNQ